MIEFLHIVTRETANNLQMHNIRPTLLFNYLDVELRDLVLLLLDGLLPAGRLQVLHDGLQGHSFNGQNHEIFTCFLTIFTDFSCFWFLYEFIDWSLMSLIILRVALPSLLIDLYIYCAFKFLILSSFVPIALLLKIAQYSQHVFKYIRRQLN